MMAQSVLQHMELFAHPDFTLSSNNNLIVIPPSPPSIYIGLSCNSPLVIQVHCCSTATSGSTIDFHQVAVSQVLDHYNTTFIDTSDTDTVLILGSLQFKYSIKFI